MKKILLLIVFSSLFNFVFAQPPGCSSGTDAVGNPGQQGLYGEYYLGYFADAPTFFTSTAVTTTRIESTLNYTSNNWGLAVPPFAGSTTDQNTYSARYRGSIYIAASANYTFYLASDDASYLFLDNAATASSVVIANATINDGGAHGTTTVSATVYLAAGMHNIQILYGESTGGNNLTFQYSSTDLGIAQQIVPAGIFCTSVQPALVVPPPTGCTGVDPAGNPAQAGLYAEYYAGYFADAQNYFSTHTPGVTRIDPVLDYTTDGGWGSIVPPATGSVANPESYSTRWRGSIYIATAGTYTFYLRGDDACYLWFDAAAAASPPTTASATINNGNLHSVTTVSSTVTLTAGLHAMTIHYGENTGNNVLSLLYSSATITQQTVPQNILCTSIAAAPLPIELLSFNAAAFEKTVQLKWLTATETNNDYFTIERSSDGIHFTSIGEATGAGTTTQQHAYTLTDYAPLAGLSYYRLKQTDFDGHFTYSSIVPVNLDPQPEMQQLLMYPNPSNGSIKLEASDNGGDGNRSILIFDMRGAVVKTIAFSSNSFNEEIDLPRGLYAVQFNSAGGKKVTQKLVVQ